MDNITTRLVIENNDIESMEVFDPERSCLYVYFLILRGKVMYVGKTNNLSQRTLAHMSSPGKSFDTIRFTRLKDVAEQEICEVSNIIHHNPPLNSDVLDCRISGYRTVESHLKCLDNPRPRKNNVIKAVRRETSDYFEFRGRIYLLQKTFESIVGGLS